MSPRDVPSNTRLQVEEFIRWVFAEDSATLGSAAAKEVVNDITLLVGGAVNATIETQMRQMRGASQRQIS